MKSLNIAREFLKFAIVGLVGTFINIAVLYVLTEYFGVYYIFSAVVSFVISMTHNFLLNKIWTFKEPLKSEFRKKYVQFSLVSIMALMINLFFLYIFTEIIGVYYILSQLIAIGIALIINFLGNRKWTFKK